MENKFKLADFHQDTLNPKLYELLGNNEFLYAAERAKQLTAQGLINLDLVFASIYRRINAENKSALDNNDNNTLEKLRNDYNKILEYYRLSNNFRIIEKPEDLRLKFDNVNNIVLHLESADIIKSIDDIDELYGRGVRSIGLTHNHNNMIGGGADDDKKGLTKFGSEVVDSVIKKGMIIDLAHANKKTTSDIFERVSNYNKTVVSHTGIGDSERLINLNIIKKISDSGGVVGLTPISPFFKNFGEYINAFKKVSDVIGSVDNLAIGTDMGGVDNSILFKEFDEICKLTIVAEKLSEVCNFSDDNVAKIMYGNIERIVNRL